MPLWSARLRPVGPSTSNDYTAQRTNSQAERSTARPPLDSILSDAAQHGLTAASSPQVLPVGHISPSQSPLHARSNSHPFPTLFRGGKRKSSRVGVHKNDGNVDIGEEEVEYGTPLLGTPSPRVAAQGLVSGKCATCRRCLMIHDLKSADRDAVEAGNSKPPTRAGTILYPRIQRKALPLSVDRTKRLIDQCTISLIKSIASPASHEKELDVTAGPGERTRSASAPAYHVFRAQSKDRKIEGEAFTFDDSKQDGEVSECNVFHQDIRASRTSAQSIVPEPLPSRVSCFDDPGPQPSRTPPLPPTRHQILPKLYYADTVDASMLSAKDVFRPLETYLAACLNGCECLNNAFVIARPTQPVRATSEASPLAEHCKRIGVSQRLDAPLSALDGKTLLLGDFAENGIWWTGGRRPFKSTTTKESKISSSVGDRKISRIDWSEVKHWYDAIYTCGQDWRTTLQYLIDEHNIAPISSANELEIDELLTKGGLHVKRSFMKSIENLLIRPRQPLNSPADSRFLLILLANPLLYSHHGSNQVQSSQVNFSPGVASKLKKQSSEPAHPSSPARSANIVSKGGATREHTGIIKRLLGLMANVPNECHQAFISSFRRLPDDRFQEAVELVGGFVSYRLNRQSKDKRTKTADAGEALVPNISGPGAGTSAHLHAALAIRRPPKAHETQGSSIVYAEDWQIKVAAKVMSLLFYANSSGRSLPHDHATSAAVMRTPNAATETQKNGPILPISTFYNTLLDQEDLKADFLRWESRSGRFSFCQYPMFLSIGAKILLMEFDARRQMEAKARDAFFGSIDSRQAISQHLLLKVRRECLVDDSLQGISEVIGMGQEEIKKALRIRFLGEEGVDAGGLRKEWFLLLVREVFDPEHGLFLYDEDSQYCYFNSTSFENSDQFHLVGVVLGLAIYNSTILDVALPPFAFRKLFASRPTYAGPATSAARLPLNYSLDDLAEWKPALARGLRQLLEYDGDVQETFCRDFVVEIDRYGQPVQVPLCSNGETRPVTNNNRQEFVDLYVRYLLDTAVARQFEPFKRGFFAVCGGNALSLFRPEEIELLVRGSDEPLDVFALRGSAVYEGWRVWGRNAEEDPIVAWFWDAFAGADLKGRRKILGFITGSDRIPAMGTASLTIRLSYLGDFPQRFPIARTCFNQLGLYGYRTREELETKLWVAINESEGFGLK
ncbi:putative E3 ubiquitin-protein ligase [Lambiella insularis]|nr:putative E3 ubiquitin-protein ligase [Lambiella insularis]